MSDPLAAALVGAASRGCLLRVGKVVDTSPLTVNLNGVSNVTGYIDSYSPLVGDVVAVIVFGASSLVIGKVNPP